MERADWRASAAPAAPAADDFAALLRSKGLYPQLPSALAAPAPASPEQTEGTTILAFKFADGVLVAGDRRATAGNVVVYDRADKVLEIDSFSLMAIAGVPATAWEMARVLEHSFQFYRRSQLQEMSLEGKVRALSKLLRDNLGFVMQGIGVVVPIFATYDLEADIPRLYFYDAMGAQFEAADYAASGSGGHAVRSILYYENTFGQKAAAQAHRATGHPRGLARPRHRRGIGYRDGRRGSPRTRLSHCETHFPQGNHHPPRKAARPALPGKSRLNG